MLTYSEFQACVQAAVNRFAQNWLNSEQNDAVQAAPSPPVFIVAGPGTGKTTVLALRVLKHIFVDDYPPDSIMATTFTKKAASELRSRILSWGVATQQEALTQAQNHENQQTVQWLQSLDINQVKTGTLDSLAEEMIADDRQPGEITPTVIEGFMAKGLLRKNVMFTNGRHNSNTLETHLSNFNQQFPGVNSFSSKLKACHSFSDRVVHDGVDIHTYSNQGHGHQILASIVNDYHTYLTTNQFMDFALLEQEILNRLQLTRLQSTTQNLRALLVDEFQDTNYLQEQIYYLLCQNSGAALTVVGDDDQSIYRFRGATVEIFANFDNRIQTALGVQWNPIRINLINNYRSSERIVKLCNHFIAADPSFQGARVPNKQACIASANWVNDPNQNIPVLGMFRTNVQDLADDICTLLNDIFRGNGRTINISNNQQFTIQRNPNGGDFGDAVLLAGKVQEVTQAGKNRLPYWQQNHTPFPWPCNQTPWGNSSNQPNRVNYDLGVLGDQVEARLRASGKTPRNRNARDAAYRRVEAAMNLLVPHLFPVITAVEEKLSSTRPMPMSAINVPQGQQTRGDRYELTGVVDVISSVSLKTQQNNPLVQMINNQITGLSGQFDVIVDYKAARRPPMTPSPNSKPYWQHEAWQVQTYAWLRAQQPNTNPVRAGILIYTNELSPSQTDLSELKQEIVQGLTDMEPTSGSADYYALNIWQSGQGQSIPTFTDNFLLQRAVRIVPVEDTDRYLAVTEIDNVIAQIESCALHENVTGNIPNNWNADGGDGDCDACDFRRFCSSPASSRHTGQPPHPPIAPG